MRENIKAVEYKENLCFKCLCECESVHTYELKERGYGSIFDGDKSKLQLCDKCNDARLEEYFNEEPEMVNEYCQEYKHEEEIEKFIKTLPTEGQELFYNQCIEGGDSYKINSQDWIDIELGVATDEVYARSGLYEPSEEQNDDIVNYELWLKANDLVGYAEALKGSAKSGDKENCILSITDEIKTIVSSIEEIAVSEV